MKLGVSVDKGFDDYGALYTQLSATEHTEIVHFGNALVKRYTKEEGVAHQEIKVEWNNIKGSKNVKEGKFGPYDADAMKNAMEKFAEYCDKIIEFGGGAYRVPKDYSEKVISGGTKNGGKDGKRELVFKF